MNKIDLKDVTFVIPVRIDCIERLENIFLIIDYLYSLFDTNIIVLESDKKNSNIIYEYTQNKAKYYFFEDQDSVFHRTKYLNILSNMVVTDHIAVWDTDVIVHPSQLYSSVMGLRENNYDFVFPYDGNFLDVGVSHRIKFFESPNIDYLIQNKDSMMLPYTSTACGSGFLARLSDYLDCGGENENFYGWGQEDGERVVRWKILQKRIRRIQGPMFHLYHPRGINSNYLSTQHRNSQIKEFERIKSLNKTDLLLNINSWKNKLRE
jgi:predicted glycosyltransferase involved in capsule biosynthesis